MPNKKQQKVDIDLTSLAEESGTTVLRDSTYATIYDRLPLFLPRIDKVLGGGLPFGRMVEVAGSPGGGKCLVKETNILTAEGYKTVEEIINSQGLKASCTSKAVPAEIELVNRHGVIEKTSHIHFNNRQQVYKVVTRTGLEQQITGNHPLLVASKSGTHVWKKAIDLKEGDFVVTRRGDRIAGDTELNPDDAYALGALVADGHFSPRRIGFTNNDDYILNKVRQYFVSQFGDYKEYTKGSSTDIHVNDTEAVQDFYSLIGVKSGVAKDKCVPEIIRRASIESQVNFLKGYMECEGYFYSKGLEVSSASKELLNQVRLMLKNIGITGFIKKKVVKGYEGNHYGILNVRGEDARRYLEIIGVDSPLKQTQSEKVSQAPSNSNHDFVPYSGSIAKDFYNSVGMGERSGKYTTMIRKDCNVSRSNLFTLTMELHGDPFMQNHLLYINDPNFYYDEIVAIEDAGVQPTFDFTMPETHSFIAEGIVNHNSTMAIHAARVATALGCIVVLIDVEGTADKDRLAHLGIDLNKVLVKQPPQEQKKMKTIDEMKKEVLTVEKIGQTIEDCLAVFNKKYPHVPIVFIWDSVGGTMSEVELEKGYGEQNVGARAKAITQFVNKVGPLFSQTKALLFAINQVRADIGGNQMFPKLNVPGGLAWEHAATIRLEIQQKAAIKKGQEKIGHNLGVNVRKSKVSTPFQIALGYLISENGLDYEYNIAKMAEEEGFLAKPGMSYEYVDSNGEVHKQKTDNFIEWLRTEEGRHVRTELMNKLIQKEFPNGYPALKNRTLDITEWIDPILPETLALGQENTQQPNEKSETQ